MTTTVGDLFSITYGVNLELNSLVELEVGEGLPFVGRSQENNGVTAWVSLVDEVEPNPAGTLSVALGGSVLSTFYQEQSYYSGRDLAYLTPIGLLAGASVRVLQYYAACIRANKFRYNFGRQANRTLKTIKVPSPEELPAWLLSVDEAAIATEVARIATPQTPATLDTTTWADFLLTEVFTVKRGLQLYLKDVLNHPGETPYVTTTDKGNGVSAWTSLTADAPGNSISLAYDGSIGEAFYQEVPYCSSEKIFILTPNEFSGRRDWLNQEVALALTTLLRVVAKTRYFYGGRKWNSARLKKDTIRLPVKNGVPDWAVLAELGSMASRLPSAPASD